MIKVAAAIPVHASGEFEAADSEEQRFFIAL
jgi:hypothetical protein